MTPTEHAVIHIPGEGRLIEMGSFRMTVKADSGDTAGGLSVIEADEPPGFGPPMHVHRDASEAFYVVSGEYVMFVDDEEHICKAGAFVYIPPRYPWLARRGVAKPQTEHLRADVFDDPRSRLGHLDSVSLAERLSMSTSVDC